MTVLLALAAPAPALALPVALLGGGALIGLAVVVRRAVEPRTGAAT